MDQEVDIKGKPVNRWSKTLGKWSSQYKNYKILQTGDPDKRPKGKILYKTYSESIIKKALKKI